MIVLFLRILLAAVLYAFLAWAFYSIWRDLRQQGALLDKRKIPSLHLTWQTNGQKYSRLLNLPDLIIGRDPACECPLLDETVSARHARLSYHHNQWWLEDLNSTNGTFLNQERLDIPAVVISGDEIRCGQVNLSTSIDEKH
ncbi:MAG: FHA domain-containing protein [Chloroflexi bacterium]|nr:FHA domain-containing protein [Chloroflexota bacterium]